jgi:hypothetical protein
LDEGVFKALIRKYPEITPEASNMLDLMLMYFGEEQLPIFDFLISENKLAWASLAFNFLTVRGHEDYVIEYIHNYLSNHRNNATREMKDAFYMRFPESNTVFMDFLRSLNRNQTRNIARITQYMINNNNMSVILGWYQPLLLKTAIDLQQGGLVTEILRVSINNQDKWNEILEYIYKSGQFGSKLKAIFNLLLDEYIGNEDQQTAFVSDYIRWIFESSDNNLTEPLEIYLHRSQFSQNIFKDLIASERRRIESEDTLETFREITRRVYGNNDIGVEYSSDENEE